MLKTEGFGAVLEVEMTKKCTALWELLQASVFEAQQGIVAMGFDSYIDR